MFPNTLPSRTCLKMVQQICGLLYLEITPSREKIWGSWTPNTLIAHSLTWKGTYLVEHFKDCSCSQFTVGNLSLRSVGEDECLNISTASPSNIVQTKIMSKLGKMSADDIFRMVGSESIPWLDDRYNLQLSMLCWGAICQWPGLRRCTYRHGPYVTYWYPYWPYFKEIPGIDSLPAWDL